MHLSYWGFGEKHRPYTLIVKDGGRELRKENGEPETDPDVLDDLEQYVSSLAKQPGDGTYQLDYDVEKKEFHGLGSKPHHRKVRLVLDGDDFFLYDLEDNLLDEGGEAELYDAAVSILQVIEDSDIPDSEEGYQLTYDTRTNEFIGFGGGGATDEFEEDEKSPDEDKVEGRDEEVLPTPQAGATSTLADGENSNQPEETGRDEAQPTGESGQEDAGGQTVIEVAPEPELVAACEPEPVAIEATYDPPSYDSEN